MFTLLTSAAVKTKVLNETKKNAAAVHRSNINDDNASIVARSPRSLA